MSDEPKALWTPDKKIPASVLKMAWIMFLEAYKDHLRVKDTWVPEDVYRDCIDIARMVYRVEQENDPQT